jgi:hypothetical protein
MLCDVFWHISEVIKQFLQCSNLLLQALVGTLKSVLLFCRALRSIWVLVLVLDIEICRDLFLPLGIYQQSRACVDAVSHLVYITCG